MLAEFGRRTNLDHSRKKDRGRRGVFYAAQVGPLARDEANGLCSRIKSAGGKCFAQEN